MTGAWLQQWSGTLGALGNGASVLVAVAALIWQQRRVIRSQRQEVYMRLEIASNEIFRFEAQYGRVLGPYQQLMKPEFARTDEGDAVAINYCFQVLNLFEIIVRLFRAGEVERDVAGSWVAWQYEMLEQWYFRELWGDMRHNYTAELRAIFDQPIRVFDPEQDDDRRKHVFFRHVATALKAPAIAKWLDS
jgi:hypothetical protein